MTLRKRLEECCWNNEDMVNCLVEYLEVNNVGEEDPLLLVNYLPTLTTAV